MGKIAALSLVSALVLTGCLERVTRSVDLATGTVTLVSDSGENGGGSSNPVPAPATPPAPGATSALSVLSPAADSQAASLYKVFSGKCKAGIEVKITYPTDAQAGALGPATTPCTAAGTFAVGVWLQGAGTGDRTLKFAQGDISAVRSVRYSAGGMNAAPSGFNGNVYALAWDSARNQLYAGGNFSSYRGWRNFGLVRINADGSPDTTFLPQGAGLVAPFPTALSGIVMALAWDSANSMLYVGGQFAGFTRGGVTSRQQNLLRLTQNGMVDAGFVPDGGGTDKSIFSLVWDPARSWLYAGGTFKTYSNGTATGQISQNGLMRMNPAGAVDKTFVSGGVDTGRGVYALALDPVTGKLYAGGDFTSYTRSGVATPALALMRLNGDGSFDSAFVRSGGGMTDTYGATVWSLAWDASGGRLLVGGSFSAFNNGSAGSSTVKNLARIGSTGVLDATFAQAPRVFTSSVLSVAVDPRSGKIYAGGSPAFDSSQTTQLTQGLARLNADGSLDTTFISTGGGTDASSVRTLAVDPERGLLYVGGEFRRWSSQSTTASVARLMRINTANGALDVSFSMTSGFDGTVRALAWDSVRRQLYLGGDFTSFSDGKSVVTQNRLARLNADGSLDLTFMPAGGGVNAPVFDLAWDPARSQLYAGGAFTSITSGSSVIPQFRLTRLNRDGTVDLKFVKSGGGMDITLPPVKDVMAGYENYVKTLLWDATNSRLYAAGAFKSYTGATATLAQLNLIRLSVDGSADTQYLPAGSGYDSVIGALALDEATGKLMVGGSNGSSIKFTRGSQTDAVGALSRLNADGSLDTGYLPGSNVLSIGNVWSLAWDSNARTLYLSGLFRVPAPGNPNTPQYLARLKEDGSFDPTFLSEGRGIIGPTDRIVLDLAQKSVYVAGFFGTVAPYDSAVGSVSGHVARFGMDGKLDPTFVSGRGLDSWTRAIALDPATHRILVAGDFSNYNGTQAERLVVLDADGSISAN